MDADTTNNVKSRNCYCCCPATSNSDGLHLFLKRVFVVLTVYFGLSVLIYFTLDNFRYYVSMEYVFKSFEQPELTTSIPAEVTERWRLLQLQSTNNTIINPHPFHFTINPRNACYADLNPRTRTKREKEKSFSLIYVHSKPENFDRRLLIRNTWGNCSSLERRCRLLFFLGLPRKAGVQEAVMAEASAYDDIVQENFTDDYHNLTHKAIGAMKWISQFCQRDVKFILKSDDDMFVDTVGLFKLLDERWKGNVTRRISCYVWQKARVLRSGRWKVTIEELPELVYPMYCSGSAFVLSGDLPADFYQISKYVPFVWVDDAYLTGFLPRRLGNVTFDPINGFYSFWSTKYRKGLMFVHGSKPEVVRELWREVSS